MKYKNEKNDHAGQSFDSKLEAAVYDMLLIRKRAGEFRDIRRQRTIYLTQARIRSIVDYECELPDFNFIYVEAKGVETTVWRLKRKLWMHYGPGKLEIWKGSHQRPFLHETIEGKLNVSE